MNVSRRARLILLGRRRLIVDVGLLSLFVLVLAATVLVGAFVGWELGVGIGAGILLALVINPLTPPPP